MLEINTKYKYIFIKELFTLYNNVYVVYLKLYSSFPYAY